MGRRVKDSQEARFLLERYAPVASTEDEQVIESLDMLAAHARMPGQSAQAFLNDVARIIYKAFGFKEISIGIREKDGMFRYAAMVGFRDEANTSRQRPTYTLADMMDKRAYPSTKVDRIFEIHLKEDRSTKEGEEDMYNRPSLIGQERTSPDSMMEGDYIELRILGLNDELLGWVELSSPRDGKFPSRSTVKWLEFVSIITATFLKLKDQTKGSAR
jgi:hypothetical protein